METEIDKAVMAAQEKCLLTGVKLTKKRKNILFVLLQAEQPLSAYEIMAAYQEQFHETILAMSVYRMLNFLMDVKLVHKLATTNKYLACSHIASDHPHQVPQFLICDSCQAVNEIGIRQQIASELRTSIEDTGFAIENQQLELHGLCEHCR